MKLSSKRLQVWHYPQIPCVPFKVGVTDEHQALKIINTLADQHIFLFQNKFIPDYANVFHVMMEENGEWIDYENEGKNWDDFENEYETEFISPIYKLNDSSLLP